MSDGILVVCSQHSLSEQLTTIITSSIAGSHSIANSGNEARRKTGMSEYAAVLISGKLPDENPYDLALDLASNGCNGVIIIVDRSNLGEAHDILDGTGVTILAKPLTKDALLQALKLVIKIQEGGGTLEKAKLMLMQRRGWTESQAHRYIQKTSMDKRLPRDVTAQLVIKALEKEANEQK